MEVIVKGQPTIEIGFETKVLDSYKTADSKLDESSANPIQNKAVATEIASMQVLIEDLQDNKVDKGDYAPALTAGFADNLVSKDMVVDSEFNLRRSGGGAISDGVARMEVVKGNSVVWNQQLRPLSPTEWYINPSYASLEYSYNYYKLTIAQEASALPANGVAITATTTNLKPALPNHAYLITAEIKVSVAISVGIRNYTSPWGGDYKKNAQANQWTRVAYIDKPTELYNGYAIVGTTTNIGLSVGDTIEIRNVAVVDLTQMFGAGNEPTTIEEFYARKPIVEDEYAYNEGEVIHCNVDAVKSVGVNQWDGTIYDGYVNDANGAFVTDGIRKRTGYIKILPNASYYIKSDQTSGKWGAWYDKDKNFVRGIMGYGQVISPSNAEYCALTICDIENGNPETFCINLSDPDFNGQYEPYKEDVRDLPSAIKEVFPNGMMSAGTAHDVAYNDLNKEVGVTEKRIGVVDLGTLNFSVMPDYDNISYYTPITGAAYSHDWNKLTNVMCDRFISATPNEAAGIGGVLDCIAITPHQSITITPSDTYTDATAFKAAMAGVMLYYELAEPIVTEHQEPFNLDYQVTNGGQEQAMATEPTTPFKAEIAYGFNASAKIKENANEIAQLKATIAQLQTAIANLASATNVGENE